MHAGSLATAGALEELNKTYDTRILISEDTYRHSSVQETVLCRIIDYIVVEEDKDEDDGKNDGDRYLWVGLYWLSHELGLHGIGYVQL